MLVTCTELTRYQKFRGNKRKAGAPYMTKSCAEQGVMRCTGAPYMTKSCAGWGVMRCMGAPYMTKSCAGGSSEVHGFTNGETEGFALPREYPLMRNERA